MFKVRYPYNDGELIAVHVIINNLDLIPDTRYEFLYTWRQEGKFSRHIQVITNNVAIAGQTGAFVGVNSRV